MGALLHKFGFSWLWPSHSATRSENTSRCRYDEELTKDQITYLHERADERRRAWKKYDQELANKEK